MNALSDQKEKKKKKKQWKGENVKIYSAENWLYFYLVGEINYDLLYS